MKIYLFMWCGNWALKEFYLNLYLIAENKDASMSSVVSVGGENGPCYWNMRFVRNFHDWEMEGVDSLMDLLFAKLPFAGSTDCVRWVPNSYGEFSV